MFMVSSGSLLWKGMVEICLNRAGFDGYMVIVPDGSLRWMERRA